MSWKYNIRKALVHFLLKLQQIRTNFALDGYVEFPTTLPAGGNIEKFGD